MEAKKERRGRRDVEERTRSHEQTDPASEVVLDTVLALRQTVRERGALPVDFAEFGLRGLRLFGFGIEGSVRVDYGGTEIRAQSVVLELARQNAANVI